MNTQLIIEIAGAIIGFTYLYYEYKASPKLWWAGIVMSLFYIYIFATSHLMAWTATYLYYLGANIYGLIVWRKSSDEPLVIRSIPKRELGWAVVVTVGLTLLLYPILTHFTESTIPVSESVSTALSVVGTWLLTKKYIQHWMAWMVVNALYTMANFAVGLYPTALLFLAYFLVSIMGLIHWRKMMRKIQ